MREFQKYQCLLSIFKNTNFINFIKSFIKKIKFISVYNLGKFFNY